MISSSLDMLDTKSSSESIPVTGVGGADEAEAAEARIRLFGRASGVEEDDTVASAAFRFLVMGGIVSLGEGDFSDARRLRAAGDSMTTVLRKRRACVPKPLPDLAVEVEADERDTVAAATTTTTVAEVRGCLKSPV
jgi:hypothetical protein